MDALLADLQAEQADLRSHVADADLHADTPAEGWDVQDTLSHLVGFDLEATTAAADPARFTGGLEQVLADIDGFMDGQVLRRRGLSREQLLSDWQTGFDAMVVALHGLAPDARLPWYGPPMSPLSFATARLMEYWAHGQDVVDGLGLTRAPTARLRHICHLGARTRRFSYANRGLPVPAGEVRVELAAPDGSTWTWGENGDAADVVTGTAEDFCLLVTQRRHRDDLALVAVGGLADSWLDIAQCFAGPPGPGRPPSTRRTA